MTIFIVPESLYNDPVARPDALVGSAVSTAVVARS